MKTPLNCRECGSPLNTNGLCTPQTRRVAENATRHQATKTVWTSDEGWHEIEAGSAEDVHVCITCASIGIFSWAPNAAEICRRGHRQ